MTRESSSVNFEVDLLLLCVVEKLFLYNFLCLIASQNGSVKYMEPLLGFHGTSHK